MLLLIVLRQRWANILTNVFYNSDLQTRISGLSAVLQAMTSEAMSIQQSWFVPER